MKKILLLAALSLSFLPAMADTLTDDVAESYSKVVDGWTYITNAAEFRLLAQQCQDPDVEEKKIRLACDIEYPQKFYRTIPSYYIKYFRGTFDGMGCTIKKFYFRTTSEDSQDNVGFIQELKGSDSKVCNLRFDDCEIDARNLCTIAVVVSKITATKADLNHILIKRGTIYTDQNGVFGCLAGSINSKTTISHCAIDSLDVWGRSGNESNPVGIFASSMVDGGDVTSCRIDDCYMASTPLKANNYARFSIITNYTPQEINKGHAFNGGLGTRELIQLQDGLVIIAFFDESCFIEEFSCKPHGSGVAVRDPEHEKFFDGIITVFEPLRISGIEIFGYGLFVLKDCERRKFFTEGVQDFIEFFGAKFFIEPVIGFDVQTGCILFAVLIQEGMHDLIEKTQCVHFSDGHRFFTFLGTNDVYFCSEFADCPEICKNNVAVVSKQFVRKIIVFSGFA